MGTLSSHPAFENGRQIGAIAALDIKTGDAGYLSDIAPALRSLFLERGLLLRPLGNIVYVMPPYFTTGGQFDRLFERSVTRREGEECVSTCRSRGAAVQ